MWEQVASANQRKPGMSVAEAVEAVATPSAPLTGKALFRNLHTREFLGHKKKVSTLEAIVEAFACPSAFAWASLVVPPKSRN